MTSFLVGTYVFGVELYQRARAKSAGEISAFSFLAPMESPQPMSTETNKADTIRHSTGVVSSSKAGLFDASEDIAKNIASLAKEVTPAYVITSENDITMKASVTLDGLMDYDAMCQLINLVKRHKIKVSFFPSAEQAARTPYAIREITEAGFTVGNYFSNTEQDMMSKPLTELVAEYTSAHRVLNVIAGQAPAQIKGDTAGYTRDMLIAAGASGFCQAVRSTAVLTYKSFSSYEETLGWARRLRPGSIVSVRLPDLSDSSEYHLPGWLGEAPDDSGGIAFSQSIEKDLEQARDKRLV